MTAKLVDRISRYVTISLLVAGTGAAVFVASFEPCEYEDSHNCYWNASREGNGHGQSFINIGIKHGPSLTIYGSYHHDKG